MYVFSVSSSSNYVFWPKDVQQGSENMISYRFLLMIKVVMDRRWIIRKFKSMSSTILFDIYVLLILQLFLQFYVVYNVSNLLETVQFSSNSHLK